jgi:hypothetical protein
VLEDCCRDVGDLDLSGADWGDGTELNGISNAVGLNLGHAGTGELGDVGAVGPGEGNLCGWSRSVTLEAGRELSRPLSWGRSVGGSAEVEATSGSVLGVGDFGASARAGC